MNLHAIDLPQLFGQPRVDGVGRRKTLISTPSETRGSFVKCNMRGSSVDKETSRPLLKYFGNGDFEKSKKSLLLDSGDMAMPILAR